MKWALLLLGCFIAACTAAPAFRGAAEAARLEPAESLLQVAAAPVDDVYKLVRDVSGTSQAEEEEARNAYDKDEAACTAELARLTEQLEQDNTALKAQRQEVIPNQEAAAAQAEADVTNRRSELASAKEAVTEAQAKIDDAKAAWQATVDEFEHRAAEHADLVGLIKQVETFVRDSSHGAVASAVATGEPVTEDVAEAAKHVASGVGDILDGDEEETEEEEGDAAEGEADGHGVASDGSAAALAQLVARATALRSKAGHAVAGGLAPTASVALSAVQPSLVQLSEAVRARTAAKAWNLAALAEMLYEVRLAVRASATKVGEDREAAAVEHRDHMSNMAVEKAAAQAEVTRLTADVNTLVARLSEAKAALISMHGKARFLRDGLSALRSAQAEQQKECERLRKAFATGQKRRAQVADVLDTQLHRIATDVNTHDRLRSRETTEAVPVHCVVSDWTEWTECTVACSAQRRHRVITRHPKNGGDACPKEMEQEQNCRMDECAVNCAVGDWGDWSPCTGKCGNQWRERPVEQEAANGGAACPPLNQTRYCQVESCMQDCELGDWVPHECSNPCGHGVRLETRHVVKAALNGGKACPPRERHVPCYEFGDHCDVDCVLDEWSDWSSCSSSCGPGHKTATRNILVPSQRHGKACKTQRTAPCSGELCPTNCVMTPWTDWTPCRLTEEVEPGCGTGLRTRTRSVAQPADNGGASCNSLDAHQSVHCELVEGCSDQETISAGEDGEAVLGGAEALSPDAAAGGADDEEEMV
eukprot:PLAT11893.1.p1 GENE.PLAT11893.1~~PLAT11893.1.p1  ORF type:complete len:763 (-),score=403.70 PLAT11893.1:142-2430(-)